MAIITDFDALFENQFSRVLLDHSESGRYFESWIKDDFTVTSASEYTSPFEDTLQGVTERSENLKAMLQMVTGDYLTKIFSSNSTLKNATFTASRWSASQKPVFEIPMTFITLDSKSNVTKNARQLSGLIYPKVNSAGAFSPPGGYRLTGSITKELIDIGSTSYTSNKNNADGAPVNTGDLISDNYERVAKAIDSGRISYKNLGIRGGWSVKCGNWFEANDLILTNTNLTFSKERTRYGPLTATVDCTFEPYRLISEDEYLGYFKDEGVIESINRRLEGPNILDNAATVLPQSNIQESSTVRESVRQTDPLDVFNDAKNLYDRGRRFKLKLDRYFG